MFATLMLGLIFGVCVGIALIVWIANTESGPRF